jgi:hypothetical protein
MKWITGFVIGLTLAAAGCGHTAATGPSPGTSSGSDSASTATAKAADPLAGVWRQTFTCPEYVRAVERAHVPRAAFRNWAAHVPDNWGDSPQSPTGDLCRHAPKSFERIAKFRDGTVTSFDPPNLALGLDATYTLVNDHTFTAYDGGENIAGTYTFTFTINGDQLTVRVHNKDPYFIGAWEAAPFVRTS